MSYTIDEHKHRYAAWAASRAASTKTCRFEVLIGKEIIEEIGLDKLISDPAKLPSPEKTDSEHRLWRETAIKAAENRGLVGFGHGVAAKLINVYLKGAFVCAGHEAHPNVVALHPPIDSLLLDELYLNNVGGLKKDWALARKLRWSKFDSSQYEAVIKSIRKSMSNSPLWKVESYWRGYQ
jgi:hypothetical protein